jgi:1-acyl-sn-glycerol-3-phosphate acyltransferase
VKAAHPYQFSWFDWFCLWYPPGWLILFNRHWQHYHLDPDGWNWLEYGLFLVPGGFYLALLSRWLRLGCRLPRSENRQFAPTYRRAFQDEVLAPIMKSYFRGELRQLENLPQIGPVIIVINHAGMCFAWDFVMLAYLLSQARGWVVQPVAHGAIFDHPWVNWWLPPGWSQVLGGVRAESDSLEAAIASSAQPTDLELKVESISQTILLYAPEGIRGPGKGWRKRYQLQTFHPSFIRLGDRYHVPVLPVVCIGNESLHPWAFNLKKWASQLGLPFLPLSILMILFILFPSTGVWAMRTRLRYYVEPLYEPWSQKTSETDSAQTQKMSLPSSRLIAYQQAEALREKLQSKINQILNLNLY